MFQQSDLSHVRSLLSPELTIMDPIPLFFLATCLIRLASGHDRVGAACLRYIRLEKIGGAH